MAQIQVQHQSHVLGPNGVAAEAATVIGANQIVTTSLYVGDLDFNVTDSQLHDLFNQVGQVVSVRVCRDSSTSRSLGYGYVNHRNPQDAARAMEVLNFTPLNGKTIRVMYSHRDHSIRKSGSANIFIKVMHEPSGISRGSGFVAFSTTEEASRALAEMNGKMIVSKPLYVALAQRKEERRARLQVQFSQMRPLPVVQSIAPRMPMYPPSAPGLGQQLFYGQAPPSIVPPQDGFGYQQQLVPGMGPGGVPIPNFYMPLVHQGQQGQQPGGRRGGASVQQAQQRVPLMQQQMMGRVYRYPPGRNMLDVPMPGVGGGRLPVLYDMGGMLPRDAGLGQPMPALATSLANAPPDQQRMMLGENLYPLVDQLEHENAAKVTGMLLEMDQTEVLHLLESPDALKAKVAVAVEVPRNVAHQQGNSPTDRLTSLSLNDHLVS